MNSLKRKIDHYLKTHFESNKTALLIEGARQIGKTYSIREYGKNYESFIEINFIEQPEAVSLFRNLKNSKDLLARLSLFTTKSLKKNSTLIFFDEVQVCPEILTYIKFLVEEGSYRYVLSGSLLGIELNNLRSAPVGYLTIKRMYPLSIEEFFSNLGIGQNIIESLKKSYINLSPIDEFVHQKMMELFRLYLVVGGMPAVVKKYIETNNLQEVLSTQKQILNLYRKDISKYDDKNRLSIIEIFNLIAPELNNPNKRFIIKDLGKNIKFDRYENSFLWLKDAGVSIPVYNIDDLKIPLILSKSRSLFKLFMNDIGLLAAEYSQGIQLRIISGDNSINCGSIFENAVAQELLSKDYELFYYNNKKRGELDFVIDYEGKVLPIEVKSGKDYKIHRALSNILADSEYKIDRAIVFTNSNIQVEGNKLYLPIYMVMFLEKPDNIPSFYKIDVSALN
ncbi:ATP-binding protein [Succinivibrio dextrinosolvens]|uniref:AAA+ ATPase domain-containing protein n=1 Tax=Succinivibrio dextrinosolvens TaxID=83771 RepID=A0A662ZEQ5_9GAMM|nr:AAA family ATPase [Succinivibrio dextrinosolvens]SFK29086.1 hypothetical protein SAMN04487865_104920 [Succinivibrio dextrinosolvens]